MKSKILLSGAGLLASLLLGSCQPGLTSFDPTSAGSDSRALAGFPHFQYLKVIQPANPSFDPTGEFIFPTILKATDHIANPLGTYYMYYAPHDAPGGISVAYSNNIEGPFTEYSGNPLISNNFEGISVSHVSSPYVLWMPEYNKFIMYYHGENTTNRWAYSTDGLNWEYGGVSMTASQFGAGYTECQYAKVFRYTIPGQSNQYIMLQMLLNGTGLGTGRKIALSVSNDGKTFTPYDANLILPGPDGCLDIAAPNLLVRDGKYYVVYHGNTGNMYITEVGPSFTLENHLGVFYGATSAAPENGRAASAHFVTVGTTNYMFYEAGQRGTTKLALAKEVTSPFYEAELLAVTASGAVQSDVNDALLSAGAANKLEADGAGDYVEYTVPVPASGIWNIAVQVKKQNARGIFQLSLPQAGVNVGSAQDLYNASDSYPTLSLGSYNFASSGNKLFRFLVTGKNAASAGYALVIDSIRLTR